MSFERILSNGILRMVVCVMCLVGLAGGSADAAPSVCDRATVLDLDSTSRLSIPPAEDLFVRVEVPAPGFLALDATAPGSSKSEPVLIPVSASCDGFPSARPVILERTMASLVLGIDLPGNYVFRLTASDPSQTLSEIKIRTGHSPFGEDEGEIESEPDPFAGDGKPSSFGEDEGEIESEPDPFGDDNSKAVVMSLALTEICGHGERDDHGDTLGCATVLTPAVAVEGEIANDWGDDADVFRFVLPGTSATDLWRVEVAVSGATEFNGVLFDRHGERLGQADSGGKGDGFRLIRVLRPGAYFVRVEGRLGAEGAYRLKLGVSVP